MKIERIQVKNYRLLKDFSIDLEDELSLVIGKNNTGKTSLLSVLDKFLNGSDSTKFSFDDLNIDLRKLIKSLVEGDLKERDDFTPVGIKMDLLIKYDEQDNLANLSDVMMDLDPEHQFILLRFGFLLDYDSLLELREGFNAFRSKESSKKDENENYTEKDFYYFLKNNLKYLKSSRKSISCSKETGEEEGDYFIDLDKENISLKNILNFKKISARRDVTNKEVDTTLSSQTSKIYEKREASEEQNEQIDKFKDQLGDTDTVLSGIYKDLFKDTIEKVRRFGGIKENDSEISIESTLQHRELLKGNTTVMYSHADHMFPENLNGLGYMNLISVIFEIEILIQEFKRAKDEAPADINILFIEEPEAHTHPQMQYIFINNIKELLKEGIKRDDGKNRELQYIISTHSSHIVAECDFDDIRYLQKKGETTVVAKSLKSLEREYEENGEEENYKFLKQYLTLNKAELFFADKAILVEGDTERILIPAMMKKVDQESDDLPMLSQNISIVEVGAHSQVFEKFIDFIGIKALIITDIDSVKIEKDENGNDKRKACKVTDENASLSSNSSLGFFLETNVLSELIDKDFEKMRLKRELQDDESKKWVVSEKGYIQLVYQMKERNENGDDYHARSFEDAFAHLNKSFLKDKDNKFDSLTKKHLDSFREGEIDVYDFSNKAINSKPSFAIEILLNSEEDNDGNKFINWKTPFYLKLGLKWLKDSE